MQKNKESDSGVHAVKGFSQSYRKLQVEGKRV